MVQADETLKLISVNMAECLWVSYSAYGYFFCVTLSVSECLQEWKVSVTEVEFS